MLELIKEYPGVAMSIVLIIAFSIVSFIVVVMLIVAIIKKLFK